MAVPPGGGQAEMMGAAPDDGEAAAVVGLHVEDLRDVGAPRRYEVPAALEPQSDGRRPPRTRWCRPRRARRRGVGRPGVAEDAGQGGAETGPVEGAVEVGGVHADAAAGVDDAERDTGG